MNFILELYSLILSIDTLSDERGLRRAELRFCNFKIVFQLKIKNEIIHWTRKPITLIYLHLNIFIYHIQLCIQSCSPHMDPFCCLWSVSHFPHQIANTLVTNSISWSDVSMIIMKVRFLYTSIHLCYIWKLFTENKSIHKRQFYLFQSKINYSVSYSHFIRASEWKQMWINCIDEI